RELSTFFQAVRSTYSPNSSQNSLLKREPRRRQNVVVAAGTVKPPSTGIERLIELQIKHWIER
ncbi:MAG: hypothetical protein P8J29_06640, partial [Rhodospirillales bacterium]|nr:hypothetical protein [Rhodospirillales bacterium]